MSEGWRMLLIAVTAGGAGVAIEYGWDRAVRREMHRLSGLRPGSPEYRRVWGDDV